MGAGKRLWRCLIAFISSRIAAAVAAEKARNACHRRKVETHTHCAFNTLSNILKKLMLERN